MDKKKVGERLKLLRTKYLKMSQNGLAKILGVKRNTVSNWERGEKEMNYTALSKLHEEFGINVNWLLTGEGSMFVKPDSKEIPPEQAGIDKELAIMISMLSPEQQEGLKALFRGYQKKLTSRLSSSSSGKREETANLCDSHDESVVE